MKFMELYSLTDLIEPTTVSKHSLKCDVNTVNASLISISEDFSSSQQEKSALTIQSKLGLVFSLLVFVYTTRKCMDTRAHLVATRTVLPVERRES